MDDAIVMSDIHLGSDVCRAGRVRDFLALLESGKISTKQLVINGDLFDGWDFRKLRDSHWGILSQLRGLADKIRVVWINGNHDGPAEIISHLVGVDFVEEHVLESGGKKILIVHGDKFDNFIYEHPLLTKVADKIYRIIQRLDASLHLARLAKRSSKTFIRCSEQIRHKAKAYALKKGMDAICCGHTHVALQDLEGVHYHNGGCWTESPCHYLAVREGHIELVGFT